jgi:hypothetical protein
MGKIRIRQSREEVSETADQMRKLTDEMQKCSRKSKHVAWKYVMFSYLFTSQTQSTRNFFVLSP